MAFIKRYYRELASGQRHRFFDRIVGNLLMLIAVPYGAAMTVRARLYTLGVLRSYRLPRPVVAVGNLTVGGTGKTPTVLHLARYFAARGKRVAVLSRGYRGSLHGRGEHIVADGTQVVLGPEAAGDEPYLLATSLPGLMVVIGADRYRAGLLALEKLDPDLFLLDDGFQHLRLTRDLNILLLDGRCPFGNGRTFPAGLLREPVTAAARADFVIYTRCAGLSPEVVPEIPSCRSRHQLTGVVPVGGGNEIVFSALQGLRGVAFAGIADPAGFFGLLRAEGVVLEETVPFPDHCAYGDAEIDFLSRTVAACKADYLITTAKDAVKLLPHRQRLGPLYAAVLELRMADEALLWQALDKLI